jgi:hypothetical protein
VTASEGSWGFKPDKWDLQIDWQNNFTLRWKNKLIIKPFFYVHVTVHRDKFPYNETN